MNTPPTPRLVVVVLNLSQEELTRDCLSSLAEVGYANLQVLLVDNGSTDGSGPRLHAAFPDVAYLETGENLGFTGGNNLGFEWALENGADYVLALNNDTIVEPGALDHMVRTASTEVNVGGVCPTITYHADPTVIWYAGGGFNAVKGMGVHLHKGEPLARHAGARPEETEFLTGCAFLLPADVLRRMGGFAPDYFIYGEDTELSVRLRRAGYRLLHEPRARIQHKTPFDERHPSAFAIRLRDRNRRRMMRRHFGFGRRLAFWAWFGPTRLVRLGHYLLKGDGARARAILQGLLER